MINEQGLRDVVVMLFEKAKHDQVYFENLGNEIAALRDALEELSGGKFLPILKKHRTRMQEVNAGARDVGFAGYDRIIQQVKAGELF